MPLFVAEPACWKATDWLDFDMSRGCFSEYLEEWWGRVPAKYRPFVKRIAREFGLEVGKKGSQEKAQDGKSFQH